MGSLILPSSGPVYADALIFIYSVEKGDARWRIGGAEGATHVLEPRKGGWPNVMEKSKSTKENTEGERVACRVRRACDDAPLSFPVCRCDAPYLLWSAGSSPTVKKKVRGRAVKHIATRKTQPSFWPWKSHGPLKISA